MHFPSILNQWPKRASKNGWQVCSNGTPMTPLLASSPGSLWGSEKSLGTRLLASTPGPTEFVGPGSRCLILHGWSLGNAIYYIAQKHHYDNAHKQLTVCCRSQELLLSTTSSCQHLFQMLGSLHGDGTDSAR